MEQLAFRQSLPNTTGLPLAMRLQKIVTIPAIILGVALLGSLGLLAASLLVARPENLGVVDGKLAPLPESPNCVSTQTTDSEKALPALKFQCSPGIAFSEISRIVDGMPGTTIVTQEFPYLHAEFRSRVFRFPDDVEFWIDEANSVVHFRSASRLGHSDLGVNQKRMEEISRRFLAAQQDAAAACDSPKIGD